MRGIARPQRRPVEPDKKYGSLTVTKLVNYVMLDGKKSIAEKIVYGALEAAAEKLSADPLDVLEQALRNVSPVIEVRGRRIGGANLQVPIEVAKPRRLMLALRWILTAARGAKGKPMAQRLAQELVDAYNNEGAAIRKKDETHRMAEANRAFAHFARY
ncbi:MAG: 30S ribosomal protein S7 [bacterium]